MLGKRVMRRFWFATVLAGVLAALAVSARADEPQLMPAYEEEPGLVNPYDDPPPAPVPVKAKPIKAVPAAPTPVPAAAKPAPAAPPVVASAPPAPAPAEPELMPAYGNEEILSAYAPLKVVGVMLVTGQALMWNEQKNEYVLGRVGDVFGGWKVMAIEESRVVVVAGGLREELPLVPAPTTLKAPAGDQRKLPPVIIVASSPGSPAPILIPAPPAVPAAAPAPPAKPEPPPPPKIIDENHKVSRAEFDTYLGDFDRLLREARVSEADGGGFVFDYLDAKSWLYKMGLRQGDIVLSIAGDRVSSVEDAARVYAKLLKIKKFTVEIDRGGQRMNMHYDLSKP